MSRTKTAWARRYAPLPTLRSTRHPSPVGAEQVEPLRVERERNRRARAHLCHLQALTHGDEGARGAVVEIEERVLAQRLDQPNRKLGIALGAEPCDHMFRADAERRPAGLHGA